MFTKGMVLQRDMPVPVYGTGAEGERVVVSILGTQRETVCESGHWEVKLPAMSTGGPHVLTVEGQNRAVLRFDHAEGGLVSREVRMNKARDMAPGTDKEAFVAPADRVVGFTICGPDHVFHNAEARIKGETIIVFSDKIPQPVAVRYAWKTFALANLYNRANLPALPFRTDDFPMPDVIKEDARKK